MFEKVLVQLKCNSYRVREEITEGTWTYSILLHPSTPSCLPLVDLVIICELSNFHTFFFSQIEKLHCASLQS